MNISILETPIGRLTVAGDERFLTEIRLFRSGDEANPSKWTETAAGQLRGYFAGTLREFDLPLNPAGTEFQRRVFAALREIPYGEARSYGEIAAAVGCRSARAVGQAVGANPLLIVIPCHRVLAAGRRLGGFSSGLEKKRILLNLEEIRYFE